MLHLKDIYNAWKFSDFFSPNFIEPEACEMVLEVRLGKGEGMYCETHAIGVVLFSLLLTLNIFHTCSSISIVNFEQVNADWETLAT